MEKTTETRYDRIIRILAISGMVLYTADFIISAIGANSTWYKTVMSTLSLLFTLAVLILLVVYKYKTSVIISIFQFIVLFISSTITLFIENPQYALSAIFFVIISLIFIVVIFIDLLMLSFIKKPERRPVKRNVLLVLLSISIFVGIVNIFGSGIKNLINSITLFFPTICYFVLLLKPKDDISNAYGNKTSEDEGELEGCEYRNDCTDCELREVCENVKSKT